MRLELKEAFYREISQALRHPGVSYPGRTANLTMQLETLSRWQACAWVGLRRASTLLAVFLILLSGRLALLLTLFLTEVWNQQDVLQF